MENTDFIEIARVIRFNINTIASDPVVSTNFSYQKLWSTVTSQSITKLYDAVPESHRAHFAVNALRARVEEIFFDIVYAEPDPRSEIYREAYANLLYLADLVVERLEAEDKAHD